MAIQQPSQYQCDNMKPGDIVFVRNRNIIYKYIRQHFMKNKIKINVRQDFSDNAEIKTYYQEDCTLLYKYEVQCVQKIDDRLPCMIMYKGTSLITCALSGISVSLENIQLHFENGFGFTFPIKDVINSIDRNKIKLKQLHEQEQSIEQIKLNKFKTNYFKQYVKDNKIKKWKAEYCNDCEKPITCKFYSNNIKIINNCECGNLKNEVNSMDYDLFSKWYNMQSNEYVKKQYDKFWSIKR